MTFEPIDFQQLNESDIREEVIAPLLRQLGYRSGTTNNVIREQPLSLRYPKAFLGKKDPNRDPILRGKADYICEVEGPIRWVIEAKQPNAEISVDDIEQAYTYANHPEIRGAIFCVCNGRELRVYQTNLGPDALPLLAIPYTDFDQRFDEIENLLSPASVRREFPMHVVDAGKPLGLGLRSIGRITGGYIEYTENSQNIRTINNMLLAITGGSVERNEHGHMVASARTLSSFASLQRLNEKIGMEGIEAVSTDSVISADPNNPTRFVSERHVIFPQGERLLNLTTWREEMIPVNIVCDTQTISEGFLKDNVFSGRFSLRIKLSIAVLPIDARGTFEIYVA